ncbi:uncharacterized protein LOC124286126 [Haliotis rubra]|uniref:uncharacterized protein LOC124286126 n=1 Tax=Haliotis rubra TaxID=36100 RepID=UPI001EE58B8F|nr:uncharacterized protein LOC124286126 [Haliotis rubra]
MKAVTVVFYFWVVHTMYQGFAKPVLYTTSDPAVIGRPFTFVCTWSEIEASRPNATHVTWVRDIDNRTRTDIKTCTDETLIDVGHNMTVGYGYLYQSLTVWNIASNDTWYCKKGNLYSNGSTVTALTEDKFFMSTDQPVTGVGSTFTLACSSNRYNLSLTSWYLDGKLCFTLGESCKIDLQTHCTKLTQNLTENCTRQYHAVTFYNTSVSNHNTLWSCKIAGTHSNSVRVIVLDTDFRRNVTISGEKETGSDFSGNFTLTCSGGCQERDNFTWTVVSVPSVDQSTSIMEYDRCNGLCHQNITLYADDLIQDIHVTCSVSDNSGRGSTYVYRFSGESSTVSNTLVTQEAKSWHIYVGVAVGGVAICAVVVATVAFVRKRRVPQSSSVLQMRNVLYEPGEPYLQKSAGNTTKAVMEDNLLYERTSDTVTQATDKIVMEENVLYEMEDNNLGKK